MTAPLRVDAALLARHDRPGPRYTSYPTAVEFDADVGADAYRSHLAAAGAAREPLSLYVHLPFCDARCTFCACHAIVPRDTSVGDAYLETLGREIELVAQALGGRRELAQCHWGGGTPTWYRTEDILRLVGTIDRHFERPGGAECSVEVDPRVTTEEQLHALVDSGFNRISLGVQDLDADVQDAIGRHQSAAETESLLHASRRLGFGSVNVDLVYGLPRQDPASFHRTLLRIAELRPDRLAVYSFAHLPRIKPHQRSIDASDLPARDDKLAMLADSIETLTGAGYVWIGMDHFALPDDELVRARAEGRLHRNFMGFTVSRATDLVGVGASAIGDVSGGYFQNHKRLKAYGDAVAAGVLPTDRGYLRTHDDEVRRHVIGEILCNRVVRWHDVAARFGVEPATYFAAELAAVAADPDVASLVRLDAGGLTLTELGALLPRQMAMVFDAHRGGTARAQASFSRTV